MYINVMSEVVFEKGVVFVDFFVLICDFYGKVKVLLTINGIYFMLEGNC